MVAVLGEPNYASNMAKRGTSTDITLYNLKKDENTITFIEPTRYPERLAPLFFACSVAQKAIVVINELNSTLGEILVMLQCCGIHEGYFVLRNYIPREKVEPLIRGTNLEKYEFVADDPVTLREKLLEETKIKPQKMNAERSTGIVLVDHSFNVKGIGTVILGVVMKGQIRKYDVMNVLPGSKTTQIRSIQKFDEEFDFAYAGDRVGLALKNIDVAEVDRGTVLTNDNEVKTLKILKTQATLVKYWQTPLKAGMVVHLGHWMQFINGKVEAISNGESWREPTITLAFEKELVYCSGEVAVLTQLEGGKLRVAGTIGLP